MVLCSARLIQSSFLCPSAVLWKHKRDPATSSVVQLSQLPPPVCARRCSAACGWRCTHLGVLEGSKYQNPVMRGLSGKERGASMALPAVAGAQAETGVASNGAASSSTEGRVGRVQRETKETSVDVTLNLDGTGRADNKSGIHFLDHMLDQIASHGLFDLHVRAKGDTWIDDHHTNEDLALAFGKALADALGDRKGIHRFGNFCAPLDEALVQVVLDLSGRPHLSFDLDLPSERIGTYETQLVEHFFQSLVNTSGMTLHVRQLAGKNSHHIVEATFKAFARALRQATEQDPRRAGSIPSSKGILTQQ